MDEIVVELLQRMQLEIEALAEIMVGNTTAERTFTEEKMRIREILERSGHGISVRPDPGLGGALARHAKMVQDQRLGYR